MPFIRGCCNEKDIDLCVLKIIQKREPFSSCVRVNDMSGFKLIPFRSEGSGFEQVLAPHVKPLYRLAYALPAHDMIPKTWFKSC